MSLTPPAPRSVFYEDDEVIAHFASHPITEGHSLVVWKKPVADLHLLEPKDYEHLMAIVDRVRNALLSLYGIDKAYLLYMDEARHVHWHIVPRYKERGFTLLEHHPKEISNFPHLEEMKRLLQPA